MGALPMDYLQAVDIIMNYPNGKASVRILVQSFD